MDTDQQVIELHNELGDFIIQQLQTGQEPLALAAALMTNGLRLYRTVLSQEDYESIVSFISDRQDKVEPFLPSVLQ